jgi:hypothetical protein
LDGLNRESAVRRILVEGTWYDALATSALIEAEYERVLAAHADILYPDFHFVPFKVRVESSSGAKKADYVLIDKEYRRWWVVEVELAHHSLDNHVLPQVEVLSNGTYGKEHALHLASQSPELDLAMLEDMMLGGQPGVLVIVNADSEEWRRYLSFYGVDMAVIEIFRSANLDYAFEAQGARPIVEQDLVTICRRDPLLRRLFLVQAPAALGIAAEERMTVEFNGATTDWRRIDSADKVWLAPVGPSPVPPDATVLGLVRSGGTVLSFRVVE